MKKKFLSLMMAAAVVATTSVSAFADTINELDTKEPTTNVTVTGDVISDDGVKPAGKFNVTIPTTASFAVSRDSGVISVPITIENHGGQNIKVYAEKFTDLTVGSGITVKGQEEVKSLNRTNISLSLRGESGIVYLKSEDDNIAGNGIYKEPGLQNKAADESKLLTNISSGKTGTLTLRGNAGSAATNEAATDDFILTLKIKKA